MKLLVDVNLSPAWVVYLERHGVEAVHWTTVGDCRAEDSEIFAFASRGEYTIFTNDLDFGTMLAKRGAALPSVIQIRGQDVTPTQIGATVLQSLKSCADFIAAGALVTIDVRRSRVRILPL